MSGLGFMGGWSFPLPTKALARALIRDAVARGQSRHAAAYAANCAGLRVRCVKQPVPFQIRSRHVTRCDVDCVLADDDTHLGFMEERRPAGVER